MSTPRDPRAFLWDVQQAARRIDKFLRGHDIASYLADELARSAVERQFEIVGEALAQLAKAAPAVAAEVPHCRDAIAFRNLLIHGYAGIDSSQVWRIAQSNLPAPARAVDALLASAQPL